MDLLDAADFERRRLERRCAAARFALGMAQIAGAVISPVVFGRIVVTQPPLTAVCMTSLLTTISSRVLSAVTEQR
jgi:hypothetical protein